MRSAIALALLVVVGAACHPKVSWSPESRTLCRGSLCYRVGELDPSWRLVHKEGASIGFYSGESGGVIEANATCRDDADAAPLESLTHQLLIGYTERRVLDAQHVPLDKRDALRTRVSAKLDGVPVELVLYVLKRNGCVFDLSYAAPTRDFSAGEQAFEKFVAGFADERRS